MVFYLFHFSYLLSISLFYVPHAHMSFSLFIPPIISSSHPKYAQLTPCKCLTESLQICDNCLLLSSLICLLCHNLTKKFTFLSIILILENGFQEDSMARSFTELGFLHYVFESSLSTTVLC